MYADVKLYEGMELHINNIKLSPKIIKQVHEIMMHKEKHRNGKDFLVAEYRNSSTFSVYHILALVDVIKRYMKYTIFRSMRMETEELGYPSGLQKIMPCLGSQNI